MRSARQSDLPPRNARGYNTLATDIVIDTCILVQANNSKDPRFAESGQLLEDLALKKSVLLCIDSGYSFEGVNKSHIFQEYIENLSPAVWTSAIFATLFSSKRIKDVPRKVPNDVRLRVNKLIKGTKPRDRTFLKVSFNSDNRRFVTHDCEDFPASKRPKISAEIGVRVLDAVDVTL
jgi:hypothetical protein